MLITRTFYTIFLIILTL